MDSPKFTKEQQQAIEYGLGPVLIIAGAGTGKTTVITHRIRHLIDTNLARPDQVLALTFTDKAASEMETRLDLLSPYGSTQTLVTTFHGLCDRILKDDAFHIGLPQNFSLLTPAQCLALVKSNIYTFELDYFRPLANPDKFINNLLVHVDRLRDEDVSTEQYTKWVNDLPYVSEEELLEKKKYLELSRFYDQYQKLKLQKKVMDFTDLICYTLKLFRDRPNILTVYQKKYPWILVDEYQDSNYAQTQLVSLLAGKSANITVVADDDQSIYHWRGASISNVLQFLDHYPQTAKIVLTHNFRSSQDILNASYKLICNNNPDRLEIQANINKKLVGKKSSSQYPKPVSFHHFRNSSSEAQWIVNQIVDMKSKDPELQWTDFAILFRANSHAQPVIKSLVGAGIPHQFLGPSRLFDQPEIRDLLSYLHLLINKYNDTALFRVLSAPWSGIDTGKVHSLITSSRQLKRPLFEVCQEDQDPNIQSLMSIYSQHLNKLSTISAGEIIYDLLDRTHWLSKLINYDSLVDQQVAQNTIKLFNKLKTFDMVSPDPSVVSAIEWLDYLNEIGESPQASEIDFDDLQGVNLLTVHSAKGLEFKIVFVINLVTQRFPSTARAESLPVPDQLTREIIPQGDAHLQEERRLFYVAMTRAKDQLFLTASDYYGEDAKRARKISPFVQEVMGDLSSESLHPVPEFSIQKNTSSKSETFVNPPISYLDYSRIQTFSDCPLHYKAKYMLNFASPPSAASTFGNVIHKTLKDYYEAIKRGQPIAITDLLSSNWDHTGFGSKEREELYYQKGLDILGKYLSALSEKSIIPEKLEEPFKFEVTPGLSIGGKIDRIDLLPDGRLHIVDYKTASVQNQLTEKQAASDLQLSIYALAAVNLKYPPFNRKPEEIVLSLYYLENQHLIQTSRTQSQLDQAVLEILQAKSDIEKSNFKCSGNFICREKKCDFPQLCHSIDSE